MESIRKRLMAANTSWGDVPGQATESTTSRSPPLSGSEPEAGIHADATTSTNMDFVRRPRRQKPLISCKDWTIEGLLATGPRFRAVPRVSASSPGLQTEIDRYEQNGIPLIVDKWHEHPKWPKQMFHLDWLRKHGQRNVSARNVHDWSDRLVSLTELIEKYRDIASDGGPGEAERLYGKDMECPKPWTRWLEKANVIPTSLLRYGPNDALKYLPRSDGRETVETLMCYLGAADTFTPCHKDLCGSSGQNIMCYTENDGSSFWFMTDSSSAPAVEKYFHKLKEELDLETHVITVEELADAPFDVYVADQKLGDMVLIPPRSCHQVVNYGGITIKTSWSRMTIKGLTAALYHELPIYRRVCRKEVYRVKSTIHHTLLHYTTELDKLTSHQHVAEELSTSRLPISSSRDDPRESPSHTTRKRELARDLARLVELLDDVMTEEYCDEHQSMHHLSKSSVQVTNDNTEHVECDFCGGDVFQSFFECSTCTVPSSSNNGKGRDDGSVASNEGLVICPSCYVEGRSCVCEVMEPVQCRPFKYLLRDRNRAMEVLRAAQAEPPLSCRFSVLDEVQLCRNVKSEDRPGLFKAACVLLQTRKDNDTRDGKKPTRSCTVRNREPASHPVPYASAARCKKCHSHKCFSHVLSDSGIHSAEAILFGARDEEDEQWHDRHREGAARFEAARPHVLNAEKDGVRPNLRFQLAQTASTFNTCRPMGTQFTKPGWYDKLLQISTIPTDLQTKAIPDDTGIDVGLSSPLSQLSSCPSTPEMAQSAIPDLDLDAPLIRSTAADSEAKETHELIPNTSESHTLTLQHEKSESTSLSSKHVQQKRKRDIMDFVLMPPLRKSVTKKQRSTTREIVMRTSLVDASRDAGDIDMLVDPPQDGPDHHLRLGPPRQNRSKSIVKIRAYVGTDPIGAPGLFSARPESLRRVPSTSRSNVVQAEEDDDPPPKRRRVGRPAGKTGKRAIEQFGKRKQAEFATHGAPSVTVVKIARSGTSSRPDAAVEPATRPRGVSRMSSCTETPDVAAAINQSFHNNTAQIIVTRPEASRIGVTRTSTPQASAPQTDVSAVPHPDPTGIDTLHAASTGNSTPRVSTPPTSTRQTIATQTDCPQISITGAGTSQAAVSPIQPPASSPGLADYKALRKVVSAQNKKIEALESETVGSVRTLQATVDRMAQQMQVMSKELEAAKQKITEDDRALRSLRLKTGDSEPQQSRMEHQANRLKDQMNEGDNRLRNDLQDLRARFHEEIQSVRAAVRPTGTNQVLVSTDRLYASILQHGISNAAETAENNNSTSHFYPPQMGLGQMGLPVGQMPVGQMPMGQMGLGLVDPGQPSNVFGPQFQSQFPPYMMPNPGYGPLAPNYRPPHRDQGRQYPYRPGRGKGPGYGRQYHSRQQYNQNPSNSEAGPQGRTNPVASNTHRSQQDDLPDFRNKQQQLQESDNPSAPVQEPDRNQALQDRNATASVCSPDLPSQLASSPVRTEGGDEPTSRRSPMPGLPSVRRLNRLNNSEFPKERNGQSRVPDRRSLSPSSSLSGCRNSELPKERDINRNNDRIGEGRGKRSDSSESFQLTSALGPDISPSRTLLSDDWELDYDQSAEPSTHRVDRSSSRVQQSAASEVARRSSSRGATIADTMNDNPWAS